MKRRKVSGFALGMILLAVGVPARTLQAKNMPRIGYLAVSTPSAHSARVEAFRQGLRDLDYTEGRNIVIEYRYAEGNADRLPDLAADLICRRVDAIVTMGTQGVLAVKHLTKTILIVMATGSDPVAAGIIDSLAQPGGNITGLTTVGEDLGEKRLELLKEIIPKLARVAVLWDPSDPSAAAGCKETATMARTLRIRVQSLEVLSPKDFDAAFKTATEGRVGALTVLNKSIMNAHRRRIVEFATQGRLPTMFAQAAYVGAGGLMFYGPNTPYLYRRAATYGAKILKGAKPADLPVEQPMKFELIINLRTAKRIGLTIPPGVLMRADRVIK